MPYFRFDNNKILHPTKTFKSRTILPHLSNMQQEKINLTKEEYEELLSWKETCEILSDKKTMESLKTSIEQSEKGKLLSISEL